MRSIAAAAAAFACLLATAPVFAQSDLVEGGCPTGQSFAVGPITVTGAYARAMPKGAQSAGAYLTVANAGPASETLLGASSGAATEITLHEMKMNGNVMEMDALPGGLTIPAGGSLSLDPMSDHLMLTGLSAALAAGQCLKLVLHFAKAGDLPVELNVGGFGQSSPPAASSNASVMPSGAMDMSGMSSMAM